jgi:excinuclease ABC subunit C
VNSSNLKEKVGSLPRLPGCYLFKDNRERVIYVGKAKSLRDRVGSYFNTKVEVNTKTYALIQRINDIDFVEAGSDIEALILEAELIKKHRPKYNISLKDDKSYLYIVIRAGKLPIVLTARKSDIMPKDAVFGPYPDGATAKYVIHTVRKIFPFRDCSSTKFSRYKKQEKPCLYGHIGLCQAPCVFEDVRKYKQSINHLKKLLSGRGLKVLKDLKREMKIASEKQKYEEALSYRNLIQKFEYIREKHNPVQEYLENPYLLEDRALESLESLKNSLEVLKDLPKRIECYDVSNISGKEAASSMVVATNGRIDKSQYKKFKIKLKSTPDDFGMLQEVLRRRLKRNDWPHPNLIVVDGGKGQVSAILDVMNELKIFVPLLGLAKKFETIVYKKDGEFVEKRLPSSDPGLKLLVQLRDESHRFAQRYHHLLRMKKLHL